MKQSSTKQFDEHALFAQSTTRYASKPEKSQRTIRKIIADKAIKAWAKATIPAYDHGFMYGRDIEDLDGHIWEFFWMDQTQAG